MKVPALLALLLWGCCLHSQISRAAALRFTQSQYTYNTNETVVEDDGTKIGVPDDGFLVIQCMNTSGNIVDQITYDIIDRELVLPFGLEPVTGSFFVADERTLDFEDQSSFMFAVECYDPLDQEIRATASVLITLNDVNEFLPFFPNIQGNALALFAFVPEDSPIGYEVISTDSPLYPEAVDNDGGDQGIVRYFISESENDPNPFARFFTIDSVTGAITIAEEGLDVDVPNPVTVLDLQFTACDTDPPRSSCPNFELSAVITAVNEDEPSFMQDSYSASVNESVPVGTSVATVVCTDRDLGRGQLSGYSIVEVDPPSNAFLLQIDTVFTNGSLDFETVQDYRIALRCFDSGGKNGFANLTVRVEPVNDNEPIFTETNYEFALNKLYLPGQVIGQVNATDDDVEDVLVYTLITDQPDIFTLGEDGSIIINSYIFAFQDARRYNVTVSVTDGLTTNFASVVITTEGALIVPEVVVIVIGGIIFLIVFILLVVCCCCCCLKIRRNRAKDHRSESTEQLEEVDKRALRPGSMLDQTGPGFYMIAQGPPRAGHWEEYPESMGSDVEIDYGSLPSSSRMYQPTPALKEMVEYFHEGDKVLEGKKGLKKGKGKK